MIHEIDFNNHTDFYQNYRVLFDDQTGIFTVFYRNTDSQLFQCRNIADVQVGIKQHMGF